MFRSIGEAIASRVAKDVPRVVRAKLKEMSEPGGVIDKIIREATGVDLPSDATMNQAQFIYAMAQEFAKVDRSMTAPDALSLAREILATFLSDEKIAFGVAGWDWTREGATTIAHECEIDHWEAA